MRRRFSSARLAAVILSGLAGGNATMGPKVAERALVCAYLKPSRRVPSRPPRMRPVCASLRVADSSRLATYSSSKSCAFSRARENAQDLLLEYVAKRLESATRKDAQTGRIRGGLLGTLREGFKYAQTNARSATFGPMVAFPPANPLSMTAAKRAEENRLRIIRQVHFDTCLLYTSPSPRD